MTLSPSSVYLYSAVVGDYEKALAAAEVSGIPRQNVIGDYKTVWNLVQGGQSLVIAVGGAALYALYYNPCGWSNPAGMAAGHTPFQAFAAGIGVDEVRANRFVNAAGYTALDSLKLAVMMAYYAVHGTFPRQFEGLPRQETPQNTCISHSGPNITLTHGGRLAVASAQPREVGGVGLYASFTSTASVLKALQIGWRGLGTTGGLGIQKSPYTEVLSTHPDKAISQALDETNDEAWWLSFWTVSWPATGDSFYAAGHSGGAYAAAQIAGIKGQRQPNYIILDPEGYNTPATTHQEWADFIRGFSDGIHSVNPTFKAGFYCNQSQYTSYNLASISLPAFIAVSPIIGNKPHVAEGNIEGYIAYTATCPAQSSVNQVASWGGKFNTVQFMDSGVDCGP